MLTKTLWIVSLLLFATGLLFYGKSRQRSPEIIYAETIAALERRDARTLLELASPEEKARLNLTTENVRRILEATLWSESKSFAFQPARRFPVWKDYVIFETLSPGSARARRPLVLQIMARQDASDRWCLSLSYLLYTLPFTYEGLQRAAGANRYRQLASAAGIKGLYVPDQGYQLF